MNADALNALRSYRQWDEDGVMVVVSRQALDEAIAELTPRITRMEQIKRHVCTVFDAKMSDLVTPCRHNPSAHARWAGFRLCREMTLMTLPQIGRAFGNRDHSTVIHGLRRAESLWQEDADFRWKVEATRAAIEAEAERPVDAAVEAA